MATRSKVSSRARARGGEPAQLALFKTRGGKRRGAGRPPKGARAGSPHKERPYLHARYPVHVVLRAVSAVGNLRRRRVYHAIRQATLTTARREDFRIVHFSIQRTHVHLLVEAQDKGALASGMQGFQISAAKHLNAAISKDRPGPRRRGAVFPDRYHAEIITSPRQARHALSYVINNWRKHQEDRSAATRDWAIDWFSSAAMFPDWAEYGDRGFLWPRSAHLRAALGVQASNVVIARGLENPWSDDLVPRGALDGAMIASSAGRSLVRHCRPE